MDDNVKSDKVASHLSSIWGDLKKIWNRMSFVAFIVTLPTFTISAFISKLIEPAKTVGEVIALTWPLTFSATILFMLIIRRWFQEQGGFDRIMAVCFLVVAPYLVALFFGATQIVDRRLAAPGWIWLQFLHPVHAGTLAYDILLYYFSAYGIWRTISAVVCGAFLAWAYEKVLLPRAQKSA